MIDYKNTPVPTEKEPMLHSILGLLAVVGLAAGISFVLSLISNG